MNFICPGKAVINMMWSMGGEKMEDLKIITPAGATLLLLVKDFGKGVTIYNGKSGYLDDSKKDIDILFTFVTRLEVIKIKQEIILIDPDAVIIEYGIKDVRGGIIKKRPLH